MKANPIIIIGMHRSGTSMLTRLLEKSGVFMGTKKGLNAESYFFQSINQWCLFQANCTWDNPFNFQFVNDHLLSNLERVTRKRLSSIWLTGYLGKKKFIRYRDIHHLDFEWGWKDPRNTILMPLWSRIFPNAKVIHIYRNPVDVARSLRDRELSYEKSFKRNLKICKDETLLRKRPLYYFSSRVHDLDQGVKLWEEYLNLAFQADQYFHDVIHIKFEDFLSYPESIWPKLTSFLGLTDNDGILTSIKCSVDPEKSYAFKRDPELINFYIRIKSNPLLQKLGYEDIVK